MSASVRPKLYNPVRDAPLYFTSHIDLRSRSGSTKRPKFFTNALYSISVLPYGGALHRGSEARELSLKVGDGGNREGGISWGCLKPPLLHRRSDMPCPKITSSS